MQNTVQNAIQEPKKGGDKSTWTTNEAIVTLQFLLKCTPSAIETKQQLKSIENNYDQLANELQNINRKPRKASAVHSLYVH